MNAFSKSSRGTNQIDHGSADVDYIDVQRPVEIDQNGVPTTFIETKRVRLSEYAESLGLPTSEQYALREMLKTGYVPEEINVHGLLDNPDLSDTDVRDALVDRLLSLTPKKVDAPAVAAAAQAAAAVVESKDNE